MVKSIMYAVDARFQKICRSNFHNFNDHQIMNWYVKDDLAYPATANNAYYVHIHSQMKSLQQLPVKVLHPWLLDRYEIMTNQWMNFWERNVLMTVGYARNVLYKAFLMISKPARVTITASIAPIPYRMSKSKNLIFLDQFWSKKKAL